MLLQNIKQIKNKDCWVFYNWSYQELQHNLNPRPVPSSLIDLLVACLLFLGMFCWGITKVAIVCCVLSLNFTFYISSSTCAPLNGKRHDMMTWQKPKSTNNYSSCDRQRLWINGLENFRYYLYFSLSSSSLLKVLPYLKLLLSVDLLIYNVQAQVQVQGLGFEFTSAGFTLWPRTGKLGPQTQSPGDSGPRVSLVNSQPIRGQ